MLPFRLDKSNFSPLKKGAIPRLDCRDLFPAKHYTEPLPPTKSALPSPRCNQLFEGAEKSTQDIFLHGAPLPLVWVLVLDNVIPDHAVPFSEAYGGPQFVARALVEGHYCIGKAGTGMPTGALVTYGGRQLTVKRYEVLCFAIEMRWNITQEHEKFQQSSFIVSSAAGRSYNSFRTSQTEVTKSMLLDSEILRVVPDDGMHYATPVEKKFLDHDHQVSGSRTPLSCDRSINKYCGSPLSPISRHVIEDMCSSDMETRMSPKFGKNPSLSIPSARHKGDVASGSFGASQALQEHYCSRGCGCSSLDVEGDQSPKSPATLSPKLFPGMGQVANKIHRSSTTPQSHS
ncbi:hypothetical protein HD554DRAFT_1417327 [Boletus coccyginus]|nr:hypothetical protein HD554DRAFT_1417327 [Boletus coccyginus]